VAKGKIVERIYCRLGVGAWAAVFAFTACGGSTEEPVYPEKLPAAASKERPPLPEGILARSDVVEVVDLGLGSFLQRVQLEPSLEQGKFAGFRLLELQPPTFWEEVDLKPGDVVTGVNGKPIEQPEQAFEVFESLRKAKELRVSFIRDGKRRQLIFPIAGAVPGAS